MFKLHFILGNHLASLGNKSNRRVVTCVQNQACQSPWWPLFGLLSWCPVNVFKITHCNSFEDRAPVDFIYGCPNLQMSCRDLTIWQGTRIIAPAMAARQHAPLLVLVQVMAQCHIGDKPLPEPSSMMHICFTKPQWVKYGMANHPVISSPVMILFRDTTTYIYMPWCHLSPGH